VSYKAIRFLRASRFALRKLGRKYGAQSEIMVSIRFSTAFEQRLNKKLYPNFFVGKFGGLGARLCFLMSRLNGSLFGMSILRKIRLNRIALKHFYKSFLKKLLWNLS